MMPIRDLPFAAFVDRCIFRLTGTAAAFTLGRGRDRRTTHRSFAYQPRYKEHTH